MRINLIVIRSKDIDKSKEFYEDILGLEFLPEKHGNGPVHYSSDICGTVLEIYPASTTKTDGLRLGFELESLSRVKNKLQEKEIKFSELKDSLVFTDPDSHTIEIMRHGLT